MGRLNFSGTRVTVRGNTVTRVPYFQCSRPASQMGSDCRAVSGCAAQMYGIIPMDSEATSMRIVEPKPSTAHNGPRDDGDAALDHIKGVLAAPCPPERYSRPLHLF